MPKKELLFFGKADGYRNYQHEEIYRTEFKLLSQIKRVELYCQKDILTERWLINFSLHKKHLAHRNNQICVQDDTQKPLFFRRTFPRTQSAMEEIFAVTL